MIGGIVSAIGRLGASAVRPAMQIGGNTLEAASKVGPRTVEGVGTKVIESSPKSIVAPQVMDFANSLESRASGGGGGTRSALQELANGVPKENPVVKKEEQKPETEEMSAAEAFQRVAHGLKSAPHYETPSNPHHGRKIISSTLEETPEAFGEKPDNIVRETP